MSKTGFPSIDKPWLKYYREDAIQSSLPNGSLYDYLWQSNKNHLSDYALNYFGKKVTYGELFRRIDEAAKAFWAIGVEEEDIVSIVSVSTVTSVVCFYALNRIGAVSNFLNVLAVEDELKNSFVEAKSKVVVALDLFSDKVLSAATKANAEQVILFSVDQDMPVWTKIGYKIKTPKHRLPNEKTILSWNKFLRKAEGQTDIDYKKDPYKMSLLAHTGGTTGEPKSVMLSDYALNAVAAYYKTCFQYSRGEVWANVMIPFVVYGILACLHMPLTLGLQTVLIPRFDVDKWEDYFYKYHINYVLAVPSYVNVLYENAVYSNLKLSDLKLCGVGGDGMTPEKEKELNEYFKNHGADIEVMKGYGLSEVCGTAVTSLIGINKIGSVGIPLIHNNLMIWDGENNKELSYGEIGEICINSPSRMIGYLNNEEATNELFRKHPDGSEWLHSGDLGYIDEDGFLFIVGRMKRVILTTKDGVAYKVFPNIPEEVLNKHKSVTQSCIVGAKDGNNQVLRAFIVCNNMNKDDTTQIEKELREICDEQLPSYSRPTFYEFCDCLPLTVAGKVDYRALEKMMENNELKNTNYIESLVSQYNSIRESITYYEEKSFEVAWKALSLVAALIGAGLSEFFKDYQSIFYFAVPMIALLGHYQFAIFTRYSSVYQGYAAGLEELINSKIGFDGFSWNKNYIDKFIGGTNFLTNYFSWLAFTPPVILPGIYSFYKLINQIPFVGWVIYLLLYSIMEIIICVDCCINGEKRKDAKKAFSNKTSKGK